MSTTLLSIINHNTQLLTRLPYTFISVQGDDAEKFLQGQLSCDLSLLNGQNLSFGTLNSPKGRMCALFKITAYKNGFLLRIESSTTELFLLTLTKYKVFFKCEISIEEQFSAFAYNADAKTELPLPQNTKDLMSIDTNFISRLSNNAPLYEIWSQEINDQKTKISTDTESWFALEAKLGIPELYAETQDQFILQYLNLQDLGAVSFKKGCYTGQEIIARMKFLGKLKKKMFLLSASDKYTAQPGADIFSDEGKKCGTVVRSHWSKQTGSVTLAILSTSYIDNQLPVYLDEQKTSPFQVSELNYSS